MKLEHNDIDTLIGKALSGEITPEEKIVLDAWLNDSADNRKYFDQFKTVFERSLDLQHHEVFDTDAAWTQLKQKIKKKNEAKIIHISWRVAAAVALFGTIGVFVYQKFLTPQDNTTVIAQSRTAEKSLPDGTTVFLNKKSEINYHYDPIKQTRNTRLTGEAYFKIAEKNNKQFLLEVNGLLIKDIGTSFNVKAYPDRDTVEVFVESGEVIFYTALDSGLRLKASETGIYVKTLGKFAKLEAASENILAYKTQIFVFDNTRLSEVVEAVNEVYDIKLKLENPQLENCRITVTFRHETVDMIAEVIAETLSLTLEKTENEITLKGNGCAK